MRTLLLAILVIMLAPLGSLAQSTDSAGSEGPSHRGGHPLRERQADIEEAWKFMKEHSPRRVAVYESRHGGGGNLGEFMVPRYRALRELKTQDPGLYDIKVHEVELEDSVFGLVGDYREKAGTSDATALRTQLHDVVTDLLKTRLAEREHRIAKAQRQLAEAEKAVEAERAGLEAAVDERVTSLLKEKAPTTAPSAPSESSPPPDPASANQ